MCYRFCSQQQCWEVPFWKGWNEVHTSNGLHQVEKSKGVRVRWFNKANFWQLCIADTMLILTRLNSKPSHPEEVHSAQWFLQNAQMWGWDKCMENPYHMCIPECLSLRSRFGWLDHDIRVWPRINGVGIISDVISYIVDTEWVTLIDAFLSYAHSIPFFI